MATQEPRGTVQGNLVRVFVEGEAVGTGRFEGLRIAAYEGRRLGATEEAHDAALAALADRLLAEGKEEVEAMQRAAYDDDGVDVSLIRWMLGLTPRERLSVWEKHWRFVARAREALRRTGHPVPEGVA